MKNNIIYIFLDTQHAHERGHASILIVLSYEVPVSQVKSGLQNFPKVIRNVVVACVEHNSLLIFNCIEQIEHLSPRYSYVQLCIL